MDGMFMKIFGAVAFVAATIAAVMYANDAAESYDKMIMMERVNDFMDPAVRQRYGEKDLVLEQGEAFYFKVEENPSTGYTWIIDTNGCPRDVLTIEEDYMAGDEEDEDGEQMSGVGGELYVSLIATGSNTSCVFQAVHARPWEFDFKQQPNYDKIIDIIYIPVSIN